MPIDKKQKPSNSIPIRFVDSDEPSVFDNEDEMPADLIDESEFDDAAPEFVAETDARVEPFGGPDLAELIASRAELKRLQTALAEAQEALARRQADFDNYRKRIERERGEAHNRVVADVARKLLPVIDNLGRAVDAERTVEARESNEFRHFLHGIELINKQLNEVMESMGITPIASVGEPFDPHLHEAVVTEPSEEYGPDMVTEEIARGYRIGDKLLRPSMVKVSARINDD